MPAYVIILREEPIKDPAAMAEYHRLISAGPPPEKLRPLVLYGAAQSLHGELPDGVVVMEFPTMEDAREWYDSPRYREARVHRQKAARHREILVEGFVPPAM